MWEAISIFIQFSATDWYLEVKNLSRRQTVFFLPVDPWNEDHKDPEYIDYFSPRLARYLQNAWKKHQDTIFWVDIDLGIREELMFYQTRSNAIILQGTLPAHCIVRVERWKDGEKLYEKQYLSPRPPPKISLKHDLNWSKGNDQGSTVEHRPVGKFVQRSLGETLQFGSSKPTQFPKFIEGRTGQPVTQEIVGKLQEELSSSDRSGQPDREKEKRVLKNHDRSGQPDREERLHKVQEDGHLKNRDDADKFNLAMDDENIGFNISGIPDATVKRSQSISVHDLIQKIESHPQKEAIQNDLEQHRPFNPFSHESKVSIMAAGNTELCEIINVEPKLQCKACLKHCSTGIIYCTCGHLMTDDSAENKKYISAVLDTFSIPNFYIRKYRPHGHRYGKAPGCKDYFTANQRARKCDKKKYDSIHDRYIRDKTFRKAMIEVGRSEKIIKEMDQFLSENHTYKATKAEIDVYRGNWWIHSNVANFDSMPTRHQPDFKKALSTMHHLKQAEDEKQYAKWSQSSSSSSWQWQTNWWESDHEYSPQRWYDHWLHGVTRYLVANYSFAEWVSARIEFKVFYREYIGYSWRQSTVTDGRCKYNTSCTWNSRTFFDTTGYGTLCISSCTTSTILRPQWPIAWAARHTQTRSLRSTEHIAHRL